MNDKIAMENANTISQAINIMGCNEKLTGNYLATRTHRTLQQGFMRLVLGFIEAEATATSYDARNEDTVLLCKELQKTIETYNKGLPLI